MALADGINDIPAREKRMTVKELSGNCQKTSEDPENELSRFGIGFRDWRAVHQ
jgi:hypothetical protein